MPRHHPWRLTTGAVLLAALATIATACVPEPAPTATSSSSPSASAPAESPTPSPSATEDGGDEMALPATCEELYTPEMLATLQAEVPPLNDPGTTMTSTENAAALELLASGVPTLRCSWGPPSERGMATNITIVGAEEASAVADALTAAGFGASELDGGTLYEIRQETVTQDDELVTLGETHYLRGEGWVSTRWINVHPDGYTQAIVASLWG